MWDLSGRTLGKRVVDAWDPNEIMRQLACLHFVANIDMIKNMIKHYKHKLSTTRVKQKRMDQTSILNLGGLALIENDLRVGSTIETALKSANASGLYLPSIDVGKL